ncbi:hypothetical protein BST43_19790 [Mycobacteroides saopaulense]|uniref:Uncharacterized protein n=1 Tax=Mycobacteroides saopaulense TaxID=1578165 RepID=A0A1X0IT88_9MYCO|nr:hypothetical protein BST43_19790 [Mycobacteroides saopaulense]
MCRSTHAQTLAPRPAKCSAVSSQRPSTHSKQSGAALMVTANYTYYLDRVKGSQSWNPFEGMKRWKWGKGPPLK